MRGRATDPDGVDTVYFELDGVNFNLSPIDGAGTGHRGVRLRALDAATSRRDTVVLRVYGVDLPGSQGDFVGRRFRLE